MKLATTTGEVQLFAPTMAEALEIYKGTGFRYLDYSFYDVLALPNCPFMTDAWKEDILKTKEKAEELGFTFVQAHAPNCAIIGEGSDVGLASTIRSIEACGMLGIHNMVIHTASSSLYRYPQDRKGYYDGNRPFLTALIPYMEKYDVSILLENTCAQHTNGTYFPITGEDLVDMAEDLNHPLFGVMWDVGHAHM